jgi:DNA-binding CsgD family transcriptional regulator
MPRRHTTVSDTALGELIGLAYDAPLSPEGWSPFLERLGDVTGSEVSCFLTYDARHLRGGILSIVGIHPEAVAAYPAWSPKNIIASTVADEIAAGAIMRNSPVSRAAWHASEFYTDFLGRYARVCDNMGMCITRERDAFAYVSAFRARHRADYGPGDWALHEALRPHLQRALQIQRRLGLVDLSCGIAHDLLDRLDVGVFFLTASRRVVVRNAEARRILHAGDGLALDRDGRLVATGPDGPALARAIGRACLAGDGRDLDAGTAHAVQRPAGPPYGVLVSRLGRRLDGWFEADGPVAAVLVSDPAQAVDAVGALRALYGLTPAEARLASRIASGDSLEDAAETLGVTVTTARWTLKQVFAKTGTRRQSALVRLVLTGPARFQTRGPRPAP